MTMSFLHSNLLVYSPVPLSVSVFVNRFQSMSLSNKDEKYTSPPTMYFRLCERIDCAFTIGSVWQKLSRDLKVARAVVRKRFYREDTTTTTVAFTLEYKALFTQGERKREWQLATMLNITESPLRALSTFLPRTHRKFTLSLAVYTSPESQP